MRTLVLGVQEMKQALEIFLDVHLDVVDVAWQDQLEESSCRNWIVKNILYSIENDRRWKELLIDDSLSKWFVEDILINTCSIEFLVKKREGDFYLTLRSYN